MKKTSIHPRPARGLLKTKPVPSKTSEAETCLAPPPPSKGKIIGPDCHPDTFTAGLFVGQTLHDARKIGSQENLCLEALLKWAATDLTPQDIILMEAGSNSFELWVHFEHFREAFKSPQPLKKPSQPFTTPIQNSGALKSLPISSGPISSATFPFDKLQFTFEPSPTVVLFLVDSKDQGPECAALASWPNRKPKPKPFITPSPFTRLAGTGSTKPDKHSGLRPTSRRR
jgi:hypothetical protein